MRLFSSLLIVLSFASVAHADRDYCDRKDSRDQGTAIGAVGGGGIGAAIDHGGAKGIAIGAVAGGILGRIIGHEKDVQHDRRDCGPDAAPDVRRDERNEDRDSGIEDSRAYWGDRHRRGGRGYPPPRHYMRVQCQQARRGYVLVDLRSNRVIEDRYGWDLRRCQDDEMYYNR